MDSERIFGILCRSEQPPAPSGEGRKKEEKKKCPEGKMRAHTRMEEVKKQKERDRMKA